MNVTAPLSGTAVPLSEVPDPVFAGEIVGPGVAIRPEVGAGLVTAPIAGVLLKVRPHAFVVVAPDGRAVLVHLGIDTVSLDGQGFTVRGTEGASVAIGDPVIEWDPDAVVAAGLSAICPIVALEAAAVSGTAAGPITSGQSIFTWV